MNKVQLFSHINDLTRGSNGVGGYYDGKNAEDFYSDDGWLMFPEKSITSIKEGKNSPYPNIYVVDSPTTLTLTDELNPSLTIGMTYGNIKAVQWFMTLAEMANAKQRGTIQSICNQFPDSTTSIGKKTKLVNHNSKPEYFDNDPYKTSEVSLLDLVDKVSSIRNTPTPEYINGKNVIWQVPVIDLFQYEEISFDQFDDIFLKIWSAFMSCLEQQTNRKKIDEKNTDIIILAGKYDIARKMKREVYAQKYKKELKEKYGIDICPDCDAFPCKCKGK